jgi:hypothetical protein
MTSKGKKLTRTFFRELSLLDVDAGVAGLGCQGRLTDSAVNGPSLPGPVWPGTCPDVWSGCYARSGGAWRPVWTVRSRAGTAHHWSGRSMTRGA